MLGGSYTFLRLIFTLREGFLRKPYPILGKIFLKLGSRV